MYTILNHSFVMDKCPTQACHASTVLKLKDESILAAWFGGSAEGNRDVGIWLAKGVDGRFGKPRMIAGSDEPHWNPVLFQQDEETVILFYKKGLLIPKWRTMYRLSTDGGQSFSNEAELVPGDIGGRGPVRSKPIRLSDGALLAPASNEDGVWRSFADRSEDNGRTWKRSNDICIEAFGHPEGMPGNGEIPVGAQSFYKRGVIQPTLWESAPGRVHALMRSSEGRIYRADSSDYGRSFSSAVPTQMPNNNSGIDVVQMDGGILVLAHNPVGINWGERTPMRMSISFDNGLTFKKLVDLDDGKGEFSYPALVASGDRIFMTYTYKRENIAFWQIQISKENEK